MGVCQSNAAMEEDGSFETRFESKMSEVRGVAETGLVRVLNVETDGRVGEMSVARVQALLQQMKDVDVLCLTGMKACTDKALERFDAELSKGGFCDRILRTQPSDAKQYYVASRLPVSDVAFNSAGILRFFVTTGEKKVAVVLAKMLDSERRDEKGRVAFVNQMINAIRKQRGRAAACPAIVCGPFNMDGEADYYAAEYKRVKKGMNLKDAYRAVNPDPVAHPGQTGCLPNGRPARIDHAWVANADCTRCEVRELDNCFKRHGLFTTMKVA